MEMDLARELDLARLAADIQHAAALEFLVRKGLPVADLTLLRSAARRLDRIYPRMIRALEWLELRFVEEPPDALLGRVATVLTGSGVKPGLVDAIVGAARDRGGPAVATADARRALRESYKRNQETLRQLELDLRPAPLPCPVTAAGPAAASVGLLAAGAAGGVLPLVAAGLLGALAYPGPVAAAVVGPVVDWAGGVSVPADVW
jgi:hypothetical protein